eukprot:2446452-Pleurochrysis_carterae.AAC.5
MRRSVASAHARVRERLFWHVRMCVGECECECVCACIPTVLHPLNAARASAIVAAAARACVVRAPDRFRSDDIEWPAADDAAQEGDGGTQRDRVVKVLENLRRACMRERIQMVRRREGT